MAVTDPIGDMLARINNAIRGGKAQVQVPASKLKLRIAEILRDEGFVAGVEHDRDRRQGLLTIQLRWQSPQECAIRGMRRVSRPGRRRYVGRFDVPRVQTGLGVSILTTSRGVMTDRQARVAKVGGELLCEVW